MMIIDFYPDEINLKSEIRGFPTLVLYSNELLQGQKFMNDLSFYETLASYFYSVDQHVSFLICRGRNLKNHLYAKIKLENIDIKRLQNKFLKQNFDFKILNYDGKVLYIKIFNFYDKFNVKDFGNGFLFKKPQVYNGFYVSVSDCIITCQLITNIILSLKN